ncbi:MAG: DUF1573 domain-containing protein [candidate division Zixibacteria bacterium]|nr:DUF1573 domain-containing protein [candidate division Zixibacteria bacterium]
MRNAFVVTLLILIAGNGVHAEAVLEVPMKSHNFGSLPKNCMLTHSFWLKSIGDDTVSIDEIKTGCSCAITRMESDRMAPGDSLEMEIEWDISKYRSSLSRSIRIFYNGRTKPLRISMKGQVVQQPDSLRPISVSPFRFELASTTQKSIDSIGFVMTNHTDRDLSLRNISGDFDQCVVILPSIVPAMSTATGYIRLNPEYVDQEFQTSMTISVDNLRKTNFTIPIRRKFYH